MEYYQTIKIIHAATASLSFVGFLIRGWWMIRENSLLQNKFVKIAPHINDTLLLVAAITLLIISDVNPFVVGWLTAKIILLVGYIVAGTIALKRGKTKQLRVIFFIIAIICIGLIFPLAQLKPEFF